MEYTAVLSPRWANAEHTRIDCLVKFDAFDQEVPFAADADDIEEHGRKIFAECAAGKYGPVADFVPRDDDVLAANAQQDKAEKLAYATQQIAPLQDAVDLGMATPEEEALLKAWKLYRVQLNRIEQQPGYPREIQWPELPA